MVDLKTKQELANAAKTLALSYNLVAKNDTLFLPVHWQTQSPANPPPEETIWIPMSRADKLQLASEKGLILFYTDSELRSFEFMLKQLSMQDHAPVHNLLVRTPLGLKRLDRHGNLTDPTGRFTPNYIQPMLNEDPDDKALVWKTLVEWLGGSEEQAHSLLHHLATTLSPGYSAVKYVLLIGEGRNGKGVLLSMLTALLGELNVSNVTRQMIAERSPTCVELNHKLANVIFDGEMTYLKDSSMEKTLVAGEPAAVRLLYESGTTTVQTNALFIEALNLEPKTRDKSGALQKRIARYAFPNVYKQDQGFFQMMTSEPMLGALLSLLIDHYVRREELSDKLALKQGSLDLQADQVFLGSPVLQFMAYLADSDQIAFKKVEDGNMIVDDFLASFKPWALTQGMAERGDGDLLQLMKSAFDLGWKTKRVNNKPTNFRVIKAIKPTAAEALEMLKGPQNNGNSIDNAEGEERADPAEADGGAA